MEMYYSMDSEETVAVPGFPLGNVYDETDEAILNNHNDITVEYHKTVRNKYRVVGVFVMASSRDNQAGKEATCDATEWVVLSDSLISGNKKSVTFTYSVTWIESPTVWATRWDKFLFFSNPNIHWFSLVNSVIIAAFLKELLVLCCSEVCARTLLATIKLIFRKKLLKKMAGSLFMETYSVALKTECCYLYWSEVKYNFSR